MAANVKYMKSCRLRAISCQVTQKVGAGYSYRITPSLDITMEMLVRGKQRSPFIFFPLHGKFFLKAKRSFANSNDEARRFAKLPRCGLLYAMDSGGSLVQTYL
jgi:hypothetical protein